MVVSKMNDVDMDVWDDCGECEDFPDHLELKERLRKTLYYGKTPRMDRPSLPMTELAVEYFQETAPRELGRVDMYWASSVSKKASISPCAMMLGMLYIDRLRNKDPDYLAKISSEDLFLVSMMLASKYLYDEGVTEEVYNDEWADSANLDLEDINELERDFLAAMDWHLFVGAEEFSHLLDAVECQVASRETELRDTLTYSELIVLLRSRDMTTHNWHLLREICKVFAVCSMAYTASALTVLGAATSLDVLKAELSMPRHSTFDRTPMSALVEQYNGWSGSVLPGISMQSSHQLPAPSIANALLPGASIQKPEVSIDSENEAEKVPDEDRCRRHVTSGKKSFLSQFLTLTLVKDTLITFVIGMRQDEGGNSSETITRSPCQCHVCPLNVKPTPRRNKTYHHALPSGGNRPADTNWEALKKPLLSTLNLQAKQLRGAHRHDDPSQLGLFCSGDIYSGKDPTGGWSPWKALANRCGDVKGVVMGSRYIPSGAPSPLLL